MLASNASISLFSRYAIGASRTSERDTENAQQRTQMLRCSAVKSANVWIAASRALAWRRRFGARSPGTSGTDAIGAHIGLSRLRLGACFARSELQQQHQGIPVTMDRMHTDAA
jgi:hypothetical protein